LSRNARIGRVLRKPEDRRPCRAEFPDTLAVASANCPKRGAKMQIVATNMIALMLNTTTRASISPRMARAGNQRVLPLSWAYLVTASDCRKATRDGVP
jgi:hypothetical protein